MASDSSQHRARFEEIYEAYCASILAYAARRTDNLEDAADIVAETFTVAWRRIGDVPDGEPARAWLYGVARHTLSNHYRSGRRRRGLYERLAANASAFAAPADAVVDRAPIIAAFAALSDRDRELLMLIGWDGLDHDEVAVVLGCTRAGVRVRVHRARKRLQRQLTAGLQRTAAGGHDHSGRVTARLEQGEG